MNRFFKLLRPSHIVIFLGNFTSPVIGFLSENFLNFLDIFQMNSPRMGTLFLGVLAGELGADVSKMEDLNVSVTCANAKM